MLSFLLLPCTVLVALAKAGSGLVVVTVPGAPKPLAGDTAVVLEQAMWSWCSAAAKPCKGLPNSVCLTLVGAAGRGHS